jgi:hypothetical protein
MHENRKPSNCVDAVVVLALLAAGVVACSGALSTPFSLASEPTGIRPQYLFTLSPTPTRLPEPTWNPDEKGHACRAMAALKADETEAAQGYADADAGRWAKALAHVKNVESQGAAATAELSSLDYKYLPASKAAASLISDAQEFRDSARDIAREMAAGKHDILSVQFLSGLGIGSFMDADIRQLDATLGGCQPGN